MNKRNLALFSTLAALVAGFLLWLNSMPQEEFPELFGTAPGSSVPAHHGASELGSSIGKAIDDKLEARIGPAAPSQREHGAAAPPHGQINVTVLDHEGQPVPRAFLIAKRVGQNPLDPFYKSARSNQQGQARLDGLAFEQYLVKVEARSGVTITSEPIELSANRPVVDVQLRFIRGGDLRGRVLQRNGTWAAKAQLSIELVVATNSSGMQPPRERRVTRADFLGHFSFKHLPPGLYTLRTRPEKTPGLDLGEQSLVVEIIEGQETYADFEAEEQTEFTLFGTVTLDGQPLTNARVKWRGSEILPYTGNKSTTDPSGRFYVQLTRSGTYTFSFRIPETTTTLNWEAAVPQAVDVELNINFQTGGIRGRLLGSNREPLAGYAVEAAGKGEGPGNWPSLFSALTDDQGNFEFKHLQTDTYQVAAGNASFSASYMHLNQAPFQGGAKVAGLEIRPGEDIAGIELIMDAGCVIRGVVRSANGELSSDAWVTVDRVFLGRGYTPPKQSKASPDGGFLEGGLAPGTYRVRATTEDQLSPWVLVEGRPSTTSAVSLMLENASAVSINLVTEIPAAERAFFQLYDDEENLLHSGMAREHSIRVGTLLPGTYVITVSLRGQQMQKQFTVSETLPLELSLSFP